MNIDKYELEEVNVIFQSMLLIAWRNSSSKTIFFSGCLKKIVFPKILQWNLIFPVLLATFCSRKYCFLFWMENERWSSWKSTLKCDIFSLWSMKIIFSVLIYYYFTSTVKMIFPKNSLKESISYITYIFLENMTLLYIVKYYERENFLAAVKQFWEQEKYRILCEVRH